MKSKEEEGDRNVVATASEAESQPAKEESKPKSKWAKWRDGLAAAGMVCATWGFGLLMGIGLPKIATPRILDMIWMAMVGFQMWMVYQEVSPGLAVLPHELG